MDRSFPPWPLAILLTIFAGSAQAGILVDTSLGQSVSGSLRAGRSFQAKQQLYALRVEYVRNMTKPLLRLGPEQYAVGLGLQLGSISYRVGESKNTGGNMAITLRLGWKTALSNKQWLLAFSPEFVLLSRMSAASFTETTIDDERFQSASLSDYNGHGSAGLGLSLYRNLGLKLGRSEVMVGGSLGLMSQRFSRKVDTVVSTSPSTGQATTISKSTSGAFALNTTLLQLHLAFSM